MKKDQKGFTLAELLIVVAIIAILVAIAIPVFSSQLERARLAVDHANIRTVQSMVSIANLTGEITVDGNVISLEKASKNYQYCLKGDGTLTAIAPGRPIPKDVYSLQANSKSGPGGTCTDCPSAAQGGVEGSFLPMNLLHTKGNLLYVTVVKSGSQYIATLGYDMGVSG